jgi:hypothetical protein
LSASHDLLKLDSGVRRNDGEVVCRLDASFSAIRPMQGQQIK